ncbi:MAG: MBL fold metallo-hydrolase [Holophaga sp.]|nr:MBL fold metallo-hydrolase [Holophaga sp.]
MRISFHGAAQGVTGSCHLLDTGSAKILVDCGLYQGSRRLREENEAPFGFDPASIDAVLLTHAHLDHCGRLPLLVQQGFRGKIFCTAATQELARMVLMDTARLQEEEAARTARRKARGQRIHGMAEEALYGQEDVEATCAQFSGIAEYGVTFDPLPNLTFTFQDAGHILGSASIRVEARANGTAKHIVYSGDIGSPNHPIVNDPVPAPEADAVVMETTYGGRHHRSITETAQEFFAAITATVNAGGNVVVPTFALERAQEVIYGLREGLEHHLLPPGLKVFVDSPMATSATEIFRAHPECFDLEAQQVMRDRDLFSFPGLKFTRDRNESKAINDVRSGAVILAGAGMCTGGRVQHHLEQLLPRPECAVVFVGYAANGTPARSIIDGAKTLRLFGQEVPIRAKIHTINGFSGHGDHGTLLAWHGERAKPGVTYLVHGETEQAQALRTDLEGRGFACEYPAPHQAFEL